MNKKSLHRMFCSFLALCLLLFTLAGCKTPVNVDESGTSAAQDYPVTVNEVTINAKPAKVVVLSDNLADVILAMGYETSLIAAADTCDQEDFTTLQKISAADTQAILDTGADVVLAESFTEEQSAALSEAGITYVAVSGARNREDFERLYSQVGSILGGAGAGYNDGLSAARKIFTSLDDLSRIVPKSETVITGCYLFDTQGNAVTGDMLASTVMSYAGITNVFKGSTGGVYEFDNLKITNPQYIFCPIGMKSVILEDANFKSLRAVKEGNVVEVDERFVRRSGRNLVNAAMAFAGTAYPELLQETSATATMKSESSEESSASSAAPSVEPAGVAIMKQGDDSMEIFAMQARLYDLGYLTAEYDGMYGEVTAAAVKAFQQANHLQDTGEVDEKTLEVLNSDTAISASEASSQESSSEGSASSEASASSQNEGGESTEPSVAG